MMGGVFGGFIVALVTIFKPNWATFTAPIYALLEGLGARRHLGHVRAHLPRRRDSSRRPHVGTLFVMLLAYKTA